jgi:hypothetical protein
VHAGNGAIFAADASLTAAPFNEIMRHRCAGILREFTETAKPQLSTIARLGDCLIHEVCNYKARCLRVQTQLRAEVGKFSLARMDKAYY